MIVVLVLALIPFVGAAYLLRRAYAPVAVNDVRAVMVSGHLDDTPAVRLLIGRSLSRARRFRTTSSIAVCVGVIATFVVRSLSGVAEFRVSLVGLFLATVAGYLGGAILGETHQLRRAGRGVRVASVAPRLVGAYRSRSLHRMMLGGAALAAVVTGVSTVAGGVDAARVAVGASAAGVLVIVTLMQHRVVWRSRPALPEPLARADDVLRARAFASFDAAGGALAWMLASLAATEVWVVTGNSLARGVSVLGATLAAGCAWVMAFAARRVAWPAKR